LEKAPRSLLFDKLNQLFTQNGLVPLPNSTPSENNSYEIALQLSNNNDLFIKYTSSIGTTFQLKRIYIKASHPEEQVHPQLFKYKQISLFNQLEMRMSYFVPLDFDFDDKG